MVTRPHSSWRTHTNGRRIGSRDWLTENPRDMDTTSDCLGYCSLALLTLILHFRSFLGFIRWWVWGYRTVLHSPLVLQKYLWAWAVHIGSSVWLLAPTLALLLQPSTHRCFQSSTIQRILHLLYYIACSKHSAAWLVTCSLHSLCLKPGNTTLFHLKQYYLSRSLLQ